MTTHEIRWSSFCATCLLWLIYPYFFSYSLLFAFGSGCNEWGSRGLNLIRMLCGPHLIHPLPNPIIYSSGFPPVSLSSAAPWASPPIRPNRGNTVWTNSGDTGIRIQLYIWHWIPDVLLRRTAQIASDGTYVSPLVQIAELTSKLIVTVKFRTSKMKVINFWYSSVSYVIMQVVAVNPIRIKYQYLLFYGVAPLL